MNESVKSEWCRATATQSRVLVDGEAYFRALYRAFVAAKTRIVIAGWQLDPDVTLLRGSEASAARFPVALWPLLNALCEANPELYVYVLAWDYSLVYALERTWLSMLGARLVADERLHFRWRSHPDPRGSHHQKFVVVDGSLAFVGGIDLGLARWDTREHQPENPLRGSEWGSTHKPFHDVQAAVRGEAAARIEELFWSAWPNVEADRRLEVAEVGAAAFDGICGREALPIGAGQVSICRTAPAGEGAPGIRETEAMYQRLISSARNLIYVETQYFTSASIARALKQRMANRDLPELTLIVVMPDGADSPKERLVLGAQQARVIHEIETNARRYGHRLRLLKSVGQTAAGTPVATYIHSKLMIVDDEALIIGSANLTNRSMGLDTELNLTWNAPRDESARDSIAKLRASLLAEHAGTFPPEAFLDATRLLSVVDEACRDPKSRFCVHRPPVVESSASLMTALFDPDTVLAKQDWDSVWEDIVGPEDENVFKKSWETLKAALLAEHQRGA